MANGDGPLFKALYAPPPKPQRCANAATFARLYLTQTRERGLVPHPGLLAGSSSGSNKSLPPLPLPARDSIAARHFQQMQDEDAAHRPQQVRLSAERREQLVQRLAQHPRRLPHPPAPRTGTVVLGGVRERGLPEYDDRRDTHLALFWARQRVLAEQRHERVAASGSSSMRHGRARSRSRSRSRPATGASVTQLQESCCAPHAPPEPSAGARRDEAPHAEAPQGLSGDAAAPNDDDAYTDSSFIFSDGAASSVQPSPRKTEGEGEEEENAAATRTESALGDPQ